MSNTRQGQSSNLTRTHVFSNTESPKPNLARRQDSGYFDEKIVSDETTSEANFTMSEPTKAGQAAQIPHLTQTDEPRAVGNKLTSLVSQGDSCDRSADGRDTFTVGLSSDSSAHTGVTSAKTSVSQSNAAQSINLDAAGDGNPGLLHGSASSAWPSERGLRVFTINGRHIGRQARKFSVRTGPCQDSVHIPCHDTDPTAEKFRHGGDSKSSFSIDISGHAGDRKVSRHSPPHAGRSDVDDVTLPIARLWLTVKILLLAVVLLAVAMVIVLCQVYSLRCPEMARSGYFIGGNGESVGQMTNQMSPTWRDLLDQEPSNTVDNDKDRAKKTVEANRHTALSRGGDALYLLDFTSQRPDSNPRPRGTKSDSVLPDHQMRPSSLLAFHGLADGTQPVDALPRLNTENGDHPGDENHVKENVGDKEGKIRKQLVTKGDSSVAIYSHKGQIRTNSFGDPKNTHTGSDLFAHAQSPSSLSRRRTAGKTLSRVPRAARSKPANISSAELDTLKRCCQQKGNSSHSCSLNSSFTGPLMSEAYVGNFNHHFILKDHFKGTNCIYVRRWPQQPQICRDKLVRFKHAGTPFAFFRPSKTTKKMKKDKLTNFRFDHKSGQFKVKTPGAYLVQARFFMEDRSRRHWAALFLNRQAMFACRPGGFRSSTNVKGRHNQRVCHFSGILHLKKRSTLEIRTMEPNMEIPIMWPKSPTFKVFRLSPSLL